jgi:hypothetical protein
MSVFRSRKAASSRAQPLSQRQHPGSTMPNLKGLADVIIVELWDSRILSEILYHMIPRAHSIIYDPHAYIPI